MQKLTIKNSFIPWSFPELVAKEEGYFSDEGMDVRFYALDPSDVEPSNKAEWYGGLVDEGKVDAYNCCAWAALDRLSDGGKNRIVGATSSMNYAFSIFVPRDSGIKDVTDLADEEILVNLKTGSHYCNLRQLEEHIPYERIKLVHGGAPHNRLLALMNGSCAAASLISPYTEVAEKLGFRNVFQTNMVDVLAYIARSNLSEGEVSSFLRAIDRAIRAIKQDPLKFKPLYLKILLQTFAGYPKLYKSRAVEATIKIEGSIQVVQWGELKPYAEETFSTIRGWMTSHSLLEKPITYEQLVNNRPLQRLASSSSSS